MLTRKNNWFIDTNHDLAEVTQYERAGWVPCPHVGGRYLHPWSSEWRLALRGVGSGTQAGWLPSNDPPTQANEQRELPVLCESSRLWSIYRHKFMKTRNYIFWGERKWVCRHAKMAYLRFQYSTWHALLWHICGLSTSMSQMFPGLLTQYPNGWLFWCYSLTNNCVNFGST